MDLLGSERELVALSPRMLDDQMQWTMCVLYGKNGWPIMALYYYYLLLPGKGI